MAAVRLAGPVSFRPGGDGGALLAHTIAGLLDSRRALTQPARLFAPFATNGGRGLELKAFYRGLIAGKRVLLADDVRNTGQTFERCADLVREADGTALAPVSIPRDYHVVLVLPEGETKRSTSSVRTISPT